MLDWTKTRSNLRYHWKSVLLWSIGGALVVALLTASTPTGIPHRTGVYPAGYGVLPEARTEITVILHAFCRPHTPCEDTPQQEWRALIQEATEEWNSAGSNFRFLTRARRASDDPCDTSAWEVAIMLAKPGTRCPSKETYFGLWSEASHTIRGSRRARVYLNTDYGYAERPVESYPLLLHELGHVAGLGHPDEAGQRAEAIMNSRIARRHVQPFDVARIQFLYGKTGRPAREAGIPTLENPAPNSFQSGIGVISGWVCMAEEVKIRITPAQDWGNWLVFTPAAYGTDRADTETVCGDRNNGFSLLFNWNTLGNGEYNVEVEVDNHWHKWVRVTVTTLGQQYLRGTTGAYTLGGFPTLNSSVVIEWSESLQNFVITEHRR